MVKLGGRCIVQKSRSSSNLRVVAPPLGAHPQKCGVRLQHWENQRRLSSLICHCLYVHPAPNECWPEDSNYHIELNMSLWENICAIIIKHLDVTWSLYNRKINDVNKSQSHCVFRVREKYFSSTRISLSSKDIHDHAPPTHSWSDEAIAHLQQCINCKVISVNYARCTTDSPPPTHMMHSVHAVFVTPLVHGSHSTVHCATVSRCSWVSLVRVAGT